VSTARRRCRSSLSRPDIVGCGQEVTERVKKTTSVLETKKNEELSMKLLDDPKIPTARRNPRRPHHFHKLLDVAAEMGLKLRRPYCTRRRHHHLSVALQTLSLKTKNGAEPSHRGGLRSTAPPWPKDHRDEAISRVAGGRQEAEIQSPRVPCLGRNVSRET
jgi:hypothetical protein